MVAFRHFFWGLSWHRQRIFQNCSPWSRFHFSFWQSTRATTTGHGRRRRAIKRKTRRIEKESCGARKKAIPFDKHKSDTSIFQNNNQSKTKIRSFHFSIWQQRAKGRQGAIEQQNNNIKDNNQSATMVYCWYLYHSGSFWGTTFLHKVAYCFCFCLLERASSDAAANLMRQQIWKPILAVGAEDKNIMYQINFNLK